MAEEELTEWEIEVRAMLRGLQNDVSTLIKDIGAIKTELETLRREHIEIKARLKVIGKALEE